MEIDKNLAGNLKSYREKNHLTQNQAAEFLGIDRVSLSHYETGSRAVPVRILMSLSDLYGIELSDLIEDDPDNNSTNLALAFRKDCFKEEDFHIVAEFKKIAKNYMKIKRLCREYDC